MQKSCKTLGRHNTYWEWVKWLERNPEKTRQRSFLWVPQVPFKIIAVHPFSWKCQITEKKDWIAFLFCFSSSFPPESSMAQAPGRGPTARPNPRESLHTEAELVQAALTPSLHLRPPFLRGLREERGGLRWTRGFLAPPSRSVKRFWRNHRFIHRVNCIPGHAFITRPWSHRAAFTPYAVQTEIFISHPAT